MIDFRIILITFILSTSVVKANDVKIIELHKSKSLDQLVLETKKNTENKTVQILNNSIQTEGSVDQNNLLEQQNELSSKSEDNNLDNSVEEIDNSDELVTLLKTETIFDLDKELIS